MTTERSYTVREIDELRQAVETRWLFGTTVMNLAIRRRLLEHRAGSSRSFMPGEKEMAVEERVRTHMLAGHIAKDIYDSDRGAV